MAHSGWYRHLFWGFFTSICKLGVNRRCSIRCDRSRFEKLTNDIWITVLGLGFISFLIRISGFILASHLPKHGAWARGLDALPGCLIVSLVTLMMIYGSALEWITGTIVLVISAITGKPNVAMFCGIALIAVLRHLGP